MTIGYIPRSNQILVNSSVPHTACNKTSCHVTYATRVESVVNNSRRRRRKIHAKKESRTRPDYTIHSQCYEFLLRRITMTSTNDNIDLGMDRMAASNAMNKDDIVDDDDVDRTRSFEGRLNRFLHQTDAIPIPQRRMITRSVSSSSPSSPSSPATTARITKHPSPRKSYRLQQERIIAPAPIRKPKPKRKRSDNTDPHKKLTHIPSRLRDTIPPNLMLLLIGVNPGLLTGSTGHAYAHPSNLFWKLLHSSGITPIRHPPSDTYKLPELYSIGNTNIVERPTRDASMLTKAEMDAGVAVLEAKIALQRPEAVALVGKSIWESIWRVRHGGKAIKKDEFRYGWQDESENMGKCPGWETGTRVFVATTTSGLAATMSLQQKQEVWNELGRWVQQRRGERDKSNYF
jgi:thymine-DNA glycosylase